MNSIENFNQFLTKKYINIKSRILKKQNKLNKLKQNGGGKSDIAKIQVDLAYLEQLKEILKRKTDVSDTVDIGDLAYIKHLNNMILQAKMKLDKIING